MLFLNQGDPFYDRLVRNIVQLFAHFVHNGSMQSFAGSEETYSGRIAGKIE